jgi:hypothetical protein
MANTKSRYTPELIEAYQREFSANWRKTYLNESSSFTFPSLEKGSRQWRSPLGGCAVETKKEGSQ